MPAIDDQGSTALAVLDAIYAALLRSDLDALPGLTERLELDLSRHYPTFGERALRQIRQKADRNAVVLLAAQRGIRAARRRIDDIRSASAGLVTYDRSGKRAEVSEQRSLAQRF